MKVSIARGKCSLSVVGLLIATVAWWCISLMSSPAPLLLDDEGSVSRSSVQLDLGVLTSTRLPAEHLLTWTIVDDRGQPVAGAMLTVDSAQYLCDAEGRGDMASETSQRSVVVSASRHTTVEAIVTIQAANVITLQRILPLTVRAIDAADLPVANAEISIMLSGVSQPSGAAGSKSITAQTGADGIAVLDSVPPGIWLLDARHADLVYSRNVQNGGLGAFGGHEGILVVMPREEMVTIRLVEVCVLAVEAEEADILHCGVSWSGESMHSANTPVVAADVEAKMARLQGLHPKARILIKLLGYPPVDFGSIEAQATVWIAGRRPWQGKLRPVLLRDFRTPFRIALSDMPESMEFGSVMVHLVDAVGHELTDVKMSLVAADHKDPLFLTGSTPFTRPTVVPGQPVTVPSGSWRLNLSNAFLQRRADELGPIQVDSGNLREIRLGTDAEWARCELSSDPETPHAAGSFAITHLESGITVHQLVDDIRQGIQMWLPVGGMRLEISARQYGLPPVGGRKLEGRVEGRVEASPTALQRFRARLVDRP